jgi:hypothetical protein
MDKELYEKVMAKTNGLCIICESNEQVELHHIVSGVGKRKNYENEYSVVPLCYYHHRGDNGVHGKNGSELNRQLKIGLQEKYKSLGYSEEEIRELMGGKIYD